MSKEYLLSMEIGTTSSFGGHEIMRVFGGWIYLFYDKDMTVITSSCFVPEVINCEVKPIC